MPEALIEPGFVRQARRRLEGGDERLCDGVRRGQVGRVDAVTLRRVDVLSAGFFVLAQEVGAGHVHAGGEVFDVTRRGDPHQGMPHERHVAHQRPHGQRQHEGQQGEEKAPPGREFLFQPEPIIQLGHGEIKVGLALRSQSIC